MRVKRDTHCNFLLKVARVTRAAPDCVLMFTAATSCCRSFCVLIKTDFDHEETIGVFTSSYVSQLKDGKALHHPQLPVSGSEDPVLSFLLQIKDFLLENLCLKLLLVLHFFSEHLILKVPSLRSPGGFRVYLILRSSWSAHCLWGALQTGYKDKG